MVDSAPTYHALTAEETLKLLTVDPTEGLTDVEVLERRQRYGDNCLPDSSVVHPLHIFFRQFQNLMVGILFAAALLSLVLGHPLDAGVIVALIFVNALIGFYQEYRAEQAIHSLKKMAQSTAQVRRNGVIHTIRPDEIVPGDIIILESGNKVPADARLLTQHSLRTNESSLTGESEAVEKSLLPSIKDAGVGDRTCMVYMGTLVAAGSAEAVVVETGKDTQLGQIASRLDGIKGQKSHYEQLTQQLMKAMGVVALGSAGLTFLVGYVVRGFELFEMVSFTTATLVSALPESLPIVLVVVLSLGAQRMAKQNAIVRKLSATESLGMVSTIITDKTGTLTLNTMHVIEMQIAEQTSTPLSVPQSLKDLTSKQRILFTQASTYCHAVKEDHRGNLSGDPTEVAIAELGILLRQSVDAHLPSSRVVDDMPFVQLLRLRATVIEESESKQQRLFVIGAPESIMERTTQILTHDRETEWDGLVKNKVHEQIAQMTHRGMRVLSVAYLTLPASIDSLEEKHLHSLTYLGSVGIIDPPRPEVREAIATAKRAGIRVIMATGDHPHTATAIAREIGLLSSKSSESDSHSEPTTLTESQITQRSDEQLAELLDTTVVFARLSPESKHRIARLLQQRGEIIAMTGDGVNDAPALKQADVGISMGVVGTDVAREASDIVLADDNFASIIHAIREGRTQFGNVRRTSSFLIITNVAESLAILLMLFFGYPLPLLPLQILWLNIVTGGITDFALSTEQSHEDMMRVPPRSPKEPILILTLAPLFLTLVGGMVILMITAFLYFLPQGVEKARTAAFLMLSMTQLLNMYNLRTLHRPVISVGLFSNRAVNIAFFVSLSVCAIALYFPPLQSILGFVPLTPTELLFTIPLCGLVFLSGEMAKVFFPAGTRYRVINS